ncbi:hypothetical protein COJ01_17975 [Priestia megaterium]|uniref:hypothetical protein n=1 Tax=Priestia megaterium TaxID=1404 RepID=UPI000BF27CCB|nr:hypothetical protein [Priestia megaterium]PFK99934.1 hypothetical protein COJ01_17975 [Priestia megaterium]
MKEYEVTLLVLAEQKYKVKALSKEEAIQSASLDKGELLEEKITDEVMSEAGISFEQAVELGIDIDKIKADFNSDKNAEFIQGVLNIREVK